MERAYFFVCVNVYVWLPSEIAGSIHPPVTIGHGDAVVFNFLCPAEHVDSPSWSSK